MLLKQPMDHPTHTVAGFETLYDAAVEILDQVVHSAQQSQFSDEQFRWNIQYDGGDLKFSHLISLHAWLVANGLMVGNIQKKPAPAPQKSPKDHSDVTITHNGKRVKMTQKMLGDALMDPSMYPGFVEAGMDIIKEVLRNRVRALYEVASGHDVESLLQPEMDRLEFTIHWALGRLHSMAFDDKSKYTESFSLLSKKLKETMQNWMLEESDGYRVENLVLDGMPPGEPTAAHLQHYLNIVVDDLIMLYDEGITVNPQSTRMGMWHGLFL
ncbi:hypothetical protein B0H14DRAFT_3779620 [Mycena olivaceomarginata]|nr:hypothetical protein B0H14DRAFT_3779620 [Mycena olivaceomarginata]